MNKLDAEVVKMQKIYNCFASAAFGLEGLVASELRARKMNHVKAENGGVRFSGTCADLFMCNLVLHNCDRVYIIAAEGMCTSFEDLYQLVRSVEWQDYAEGKEAFNVSAKCARSKLMSPRDCQSVTKRAILDKLKASKGQNTFPESGAPLWINVSIHSDYAKILINTSGEALSKRGYRTWNGEAPLRETLAAALVQLSPWHSDRPLYDPCCGTGTILIEAAFLAAHHAPGLNRHFSAESLYCFRTNPFAEIRDSIAREENPDICVNIAGSDISPDAENLAVRHIRQAGMQNLIRTCCKPLQELVLPEKDGVFICNPPYGERLSDRRSCHELYRDLRSLKNRHPGWSMCVISSDPSFERAFGKRADRKRRVYNGRLECTYYIYL